MQRRWPWWGSVLVARGDCECGGCCVRNLKRSITELYGFFIVD